MFQEYFANSEYLIWPMVGLLIFVMLFLGVLAYVFFGLRDQDKVDEIAADASAIDAPKAVRTRRRRQLVLSLGD